MTVLADERFSMPKGILYCVATPIGNLDDISERAKQTLANVDKIYAEDTRVTRQLLNHFGIQQTLSSLHDHNEAERIASIVAELEQGLNLALVSDAGTPLISDPGYKLVNALGQLGIKVVPIPGASALITALSVAGLPTDRFAFEGFLPAKSASRRKILEELKLETRTLVFYESSHRIVDTLQDFVISFDNDRKLVILRELTKLFETIYRGTVSELAEKIKHDNDMQKGEFVLVIAGKELNNSVDDEELIKLNKLITILIGELSVKQAVSIASKLVNLPKNYIYKYCLEHFKTDD